MGSVPQSSASQNIIVVKDQSGYYEFTPGLGKAFNAAHSSIRVWPLPGQRGSAPGPASPYSIIPCQTDIIGSTNQPLDGTVRELNFDSGTLEAGVLAAYRVNGQLLGLPVSQMPAAVLWRNDVFSALHLSPPHSTWKLSDVIATATTFKNAISAGSIKTVRWALNPPLNTVFSDWVWAEAFILGYGGTLVSNGRFALDAAATRGLAEYVDLIRRFGPPFTQRGQPDTPYTAKGGAAYWGQYAMHLVQAPGTYGGLSWVTWARVPHFPVRSVIPTSTRGVCTVALPGVRATDLRATVTAMLWLYEPSAQVYLEASSQIPLVADPTAQANFWSKIVPTLPKTLTYPGLVSVGDWKNFVPYDQGWIVHPPAGRGIGDQVIVPALTKPSALPQLVAAWEKSVQGA